MNFYWREGEKAFLERILRNFRIEKIFAYKAIVILMLK